MTRTKMTLRLVLPLILAAGTTGCAGDRESPQFAPEIVHGVPTVTARRTSVPDWFEAVGTIRAAQTSQLASQTMGTIVEIRAHEGDRVQRGQVLAVIDDAQPRAERERAMAAQDAAEHEIAAAESDLNLAQVTLERYETLYQRKSVSPQEFDEIKAHREAAQAHRDRALAGQAQARASLAQAQTSLERTLLRAPYEGVITETRADPGTLASPGMPIFTVEDTRMYRLEVTVDESDADHVQVGQSVSTVVDALNDAEFVGKLVRLVPAADPASRSFLVKVELPADPRLRSGMSGHARFAKGERMTLLIPRTAVVNRGQLQGVYVVDVNQIATMRYVTLGRTTGLQVEVLSGLENGEMLIAEPGDRQLGGKRIEAQQ